MTPKRRMTRGQRLAYFYFRWLVAIGLFFRAWRDPSIWSLLSAMVPVLYWHVKLNNADMDHFMHRKRRPWERY